MIIHSIYKYVNNVTGKCYIGYTKNFEQRHKHHVQKSTTLNSAFYGAVRKYGWESFTKEIIYQSKDGNHCLNVMENYFIKEYKSHVNENGYNQTDGGDGMRNPSDKTRWLIGTANRGKKRGPPSEETRRKIGLANSQKTRTEEQKEHLRRINLGSKKSESTVLKHSKRYIVTDPTGQETEVVNLFKFCKENSLNQGAMSCVARGTKTQHKGWKVRFF